MRKGPLIALSIFLIGTIAVLIAGAYSVKIKNFLDRLFRESQKDTHKTELKKLMISFQSMEDGLISILGREVYEKVDPKELQKIRFWFRVRRMGTGIFFGCIPIAMITLFFK